MRIAVFTSQFPGRVSTFFARDMRVLLEAGFTVDIFPFYPRDEDMGQSVPNILDERVLPRKQVHHLSLSRSLWQGGRRLLGTPAQVAADAAQVLGSAAHFGRDPLAKSAYVLPKGLAWTKYHPKTYDYVLSYWGNYTAACAYMSHRYSTPRAPFSMVLHVGTVLYRQQVFLRQKLRYADTIFVVFAFDRQCIRRLYPGIFDQIDPHIHIYHVGLDLASLEYRSGGRSSADLRALAAELQITDRVQFSDWLPFNEVRAAMIPGDNTGASFDGHRRCRTHRDQGGDGAGPAGGRLAGGGDSRTARQRQLRHARTATR